MQYSSKQNVLFRIITSSQPVPFMAKKIALFFNNFLITSSANWPYGIKSLRIKMGRKKIVSFIPIMVQQQQQPKKRYALSNSK